MDILASEDPLSLTFSLILCMQSFSLGKAAKKQFLQMVYFVFPNENPRRKFFKYFRRSHHESVNFFKELFCCYSSREYCLWFHYHSSSFHDSWISFTSKLNWVFLLNYSHCLKPDKVKTQYHVLEVSVLPGWSYSQVFSRCYQLWKEELPLCAPFCKPFLL